MKFILQCWRGWKYSANKFSTINCICSEFFHHWITVSYKVTCYRVSKIECSNTKPFAHFSLSMFWFPSHPLVFLPGRCSFSHFLLVLWFIMLLLTGYIIHITWVVSSLFYLPPSLCVSPLPAPWSEHFFSFWLSGGRWLFYYFVLYLFLMTIKFFSMWILAICYSSLMKYLSSLLILPGRPYIWK